MFRISIHIPPPLIHLDIVLILLALSYIMELFLTIKYHPKQTLSIRTCYILHGRIVTFSSELLVKYLNFVQYTQRSAWPHLIAAPLSPEAGCYDAMCGPLLLEVLFLSDIPVQERFALIEYYRHWDFFLCNSPSQLIQYQIVRGNSRLSQIETKDKSLQVNIFPIIFDQEFSFFLKQPKYKSCIIWFELIILQLMKQNGYLMRQQSNLFYNQILETILNYITANIVSNFMRRTYIDINKYDRSNLKKQPKYPMETRKKKIKLQSAVDINASFRQQVKYQEKTSSKANNNDQSFFNANQSSTPQDYDDEDVKFHNQSQPIIEKQVKIQFVQIQIEILNNSSVVDEESAGIKIEAKDIKNIINSMVEETSISNITVNYCHYQPCIFFQYINRSNNIICDILFSDVVKYNKNKFMACPELIKMLYERLYTRVKPKYFKIAVFGIEKAKQQNQNITKQMVFQFNAKDELIFYYEENQNQKLNFCLIDKNLNFIDFDGDWIDQNSQKYPNQRKLYDKLLKKQLQKGLKVQIQEQGLMKNEDQGNNQIQEYQSSDSEEYQQINLQQISELKQRLNQLLVNDLQHCVNLAKLKLENIQIAKSQMESGKKQKIKMLQTQYQIYSQNLQNFKKSVEKITQTKQKLQSAASQTKQFYQKSIKKIIVAKRQLQSKLPILSKKKQILTSLKQNQLLIIESQTGSGKSTQLPQILCQFYQLFDNPNQKPILVTQPRKLSTRTLAQRVAQELGEKIGCFVDYKHGADKQISKQAKIVFQLDRLVLDELTVDQVLSKYSCLIIDQAHERTISIDVILGFIKKLLKKRKDFKVIVTSASMDITLFQKYFNVQALKISGRQHSVNIQYKQYNLYNNIQKIQKVLKEEILLNQHSIQQKYKGHILVFCTNEEQISKLADIYHKKLNPKVFQILTLHRNSIKQEQTKVFLPSNHHKLIFASRLAETAITIDNVRVVIDPGEERQMIYDQKYKFSSQKIRQISQSSAKQRAGRAGRTAPGHCFRLYSYSNYCGRQMGRQPQMTKSSLDTVVLRLKSLKIKNILIFQFISKPSESGLKQSLSTLIMIDALSVSEQITQIGKLMLKIPIEPIFARSLIQAILVQHKIRDGVFIDKRLTKMNAKQKNKTEQADVITDIAKILSLIANSSNLFHINQDIKIDKTLQNIKKYAHKDGDFFYLKKISKQFSKISSSRSQDKKKINQINKFVRQRSLNKQALYQALQLQKQIFKIVQDLSFNYAIMENELNQTEVKLRACRNYNDVVLSCLITSFAQNLCLTINNNQLLGYLVVAQGKPVILEQTSSLRLLNIKAKWILCHDLYSNQNCRFFCRFAQPIDFSFLNETVSNYIMQKFNLTKAQKLKPTFTCIQKHLPTKLYHSIKQLYRKTMNEIIDQQTLFWRSTYIFNDECNNFVVYVLNDQTNVQAIDNLKEEYYQFFKNIEQSYAKTNQSHTYFANYKFQFGDGFNLCGMAKSMLQDIYLSGMSTQIYQKIIVFLKSKIQNIGTIQENKNKKQIKVSFFAQSCTYFEIIQQLSQEYGNKLIMKFVTKPQREQQSQKTILIFFAGKRKQGSTLFLNYKDYDVDGFKNKNSGYKRKIIKNQFSTEMLQLLKTYLKQINSSKIHIKKLTEHYNLTPEICNQIINEYDQRLSLSQCGFGIQWQIDEIDEQQIAEILHYIISSISYKYQGQRLYMPCSITAVRQPNTQLINTTEEKWKDNIYSLLQTYNLNFSDVHVKMWGNTSLNSQIQQSNLELFVQINSSKTDIYQICKDMDGQSNILGGDKVHVKVNYELILAVISCDLFQIRKQSFQQFIKQFYQQYSSLTINYENITPKRMKKMLIIGTSNNFNHLKQIKQKIRSFFKINTLQLTQHQQIIIEHVDGYQFIKKLSTKQRKIHFYHPPQGYHLKLYCQSQFNKSIINSIQNKLNQQIYEHIVQRKYNYNTDLHQIIVIINNYKTSLLKKNKVEIFQYQITVHLKQISIYSKQQHIAHLLQLIQSAINKQKEKYDLTFCQLCYSKKANQYLPINCKHSFCRDCLTHYITSFKTQHFELIKCPQQWCKQTLNINDIQLLIGQQLFQKYCDNRIIEYALSYPQYINFCPRCQFILKNNQSDCNYCGFTFCLKCKFNHCQKGQSKYKNYDCDYILQHLNKQMVSKQIIKEYLCKFCNKIFYIDFNCSVGNQKDCDCKKNRQCEHFTFCRNQHVCKDDCYNKRYMKYLKQSILKQSCW